jgi:shikimate dehydrogenase
VSPVRLAGVLGRPVDHSLSPLLHNTAYRALGLEWSYHAFEVSPEDFAAAVAGARALGFAGLSVTMPHKEQAAALADHRSPTARRLGAANTLLLSDGGIRAESTDGAGLLADLRDEAGFDPASKRCAVIGAGGAGRAVVLALSEAGASEVLVVNKTAVNAFRAAALTNGRARVARPEEIESADLVVQATPAGMSGVGEGLLPDRVDPGRLGAGQLVVDLVYSPPETAFMKEAARNGARVRNGLGMLVRQAGLQVFLFTGAEPPLEQMWQAVGGQGEAARRG